MTYNKIMQSFFAMFLAVALFAVSFTSNAAGLPEETVEPVAEVNPMSESAVKTIEVVENVYEQGQKKVEEQKAKAAEFEAAKKLLAALIFCEAGNQPYKGQVAVGAVVMNRIASGKYPNTLKAVIYQKGQFGPARTGKLDRVLRNGSYTATNLQAAEDALNGVDPVEGCLYFGCGKKGIKIGAHYFH